MDQHKNESRARFEGWKLALGALLLLAGAIGASRYAASRVATPPMAASEPVAVASKPTEIKRYQVPVTPSQPSKGPADAVVTIVEWCELQSAACKQVEPTVLAVLAKYPTQVRLAFRHFEDPTRPPDVAEFSRIAFEKAGKFWQARELIMASATVPTRDELEHYADQLGLDVPATLSELDKHTHAAHVMADRMFATMFDVSESPAFFVNGRRLQGPPSAAAFTALIEDEITRTTQLVQKGVPKDRVYAELTKDGAWQRPGSTRPN